MKAPEKIFLSVEKGEDWTHAMWTKKDPKEQEFSELDKHEEYIRKDALLEWAKETYLNKNASAIRKVCFKQLVEKLLSM